MSKPKYMKSRFFNSQNDRVYLAEDFADYFASFIGNGVIPMDRKNNKYLDGLKVKIKEGLTLKVNPGKAIINGYYAVIDKNDYPELQLDPPGNMDRIDRIVIRLDLKNRYIDLKILKGSSSSNPKPANYLRTDDYYDLVIADIYIDANIDSLTDNNIIDQRSNSILCGWSELNINTPAIGGSYGVPGGTIIAWYPKKDADGHYKIPEGWIVCDGSNGTPDLRDRFIMGGSIAESHDTGGNNQIQLNENNLPKHTHKASIKAAGNHKHPRWLSDEKNGISDFRTRISGYNQQHNILKTDQDINELWSYLGSAGSHIHDIKLLESGENKPFDNRPAFYKLVYLMKL